MLRLFREPWVCHKCPPLMAIPGFLSCFSASKPVNGLVHGPKLVVPGDQLDLLDPDLIEQDEISDDIQDVLFEKDAGNKSLLDISLLFYPGSSRLQPWERGLYLSIPCSDHNQLQPLRPVPAAEGC